MHHSNNADRFTAAGATPADAGQAVAALIAADLAYDNARKAMASAKRANKHQPLSPTHPAVVRMHQAADHRSRLLAQLQQVAA